MTTILIYAKEFGHITNGPAKIVRQYYDYGLSREDVRLIILTEDPPDTPMERVFGQPMFSWATRLPLKLGKIKFSLHYHLRIRSFLREHPEFHPDLILFTDGSSGIWTSLFGIRNIPVALMVNDDDYLTARRPGWWKKRRTRVFFWHYYVEQVAAKSADFVITTANYIRDLIIQEYQIEVSKLAVIYPSIDIKEYKDQRSLANSSVNPPIDTQNIDLLLVKSSPLRAGLIELCEAISLLSNYYFRITLIGPIQDPIIEYHIPTPANLSVKYLGPRSQREVFNHLQSCHFFCMPSRRDASPTAIMEALFFGTIVISTNVGDIPKILNNGQNGYLAERCTPEAIAKAIKEAITDSTENHERKRAAGREWVKKHFNKDDMNAKFFALIQQLISDRK